MGETVIKCVGKKIIITDNVIKISKFIGKDVEFLINKISKINFTRGTLDRNGTLSIIGETKTGKLEEEKAMFWYTKNDIVEVAVENILNKSNNNLNEYTPKKVKFFDQLAIDNETKKEKQKKKESYNNQVCCPKCGSTQLTANKKGFSLGKALVGGIAFVPIAGVATGLIGKNKIIITCLNCGKQFKPGK